MSIISRYLRLVVITGICFFSLLIIYFIGSFVMNEARVGAVDTSKVVFQATCDNSQLYLLKNHIRGGFDAPDRYSFQMSLQHDGENRETTLPEYDSYLRGRFSIFQHRTQTYFITPLDKSVQKSFYMGIPGKNVSQLSISSSIFSEEEYESIKACVLDNLESFERAYKQINVITYGDLSTSATSGAKFACSDNQHLEFSGNGSFVDYVVLMTDKPYSYVPIGYFDGESVLHKIDYDYLYSEIKKLENNPNNYIGVEEELGKLTQYLKVKDSVFQLLSSCRNMSGKTILDYYTLE